MWFPTLKTHKNLSVFFPSQENLIDKVLMSHVVGNPLDLKNAPLFTTKTLKNSRFWSEAASSLLEKVFLTRKSYTVNRKY